MQITELQTAIKNLQREIENCISERDQDNIDWLEYIKEYSEFKELSREIIVKLIDKIIVYENDRLEIIFRYKDEYSDLEVFANAANK
jgi:hypothetical protein